MTTRLGPAGGTSTCRGCLEQITWDGYAWLHDRTGMRICQVVARPMVHHPSCPARPSGDLVVCTCPAGSSR